MLRRSSSICRSRSDTVMGLWDSRHPGTPGTPDTHTPGLQTPTLRTADTHTPGLPADCRHPHSGTPRDSRHPLCARRKLGAPTLRASRSNSSNRAARWRRSVEHLTESGYSVTLYLTVNVDIISVTTPRCCHWSLTDAYLRPPPDRSRGPGRGLPLHRAMRPQGVPLRQTRTRGVITTTARPGFAIGYFTLQDSSELRSANMRL
jgi:hypothetical protein